MQNKIIPVIITYNEMDNIARTLESLSWAKKILIVDSFSNDGTVEYCATQKNIQLVQHPFSSFAEQCNFALEQLSPDDWILSLDADYQLSEELIAELATLTDDGSNQAYQCSFIYAINGQQLNASLYPPRTVLYRNSTANYENDGHAHRVKVSSNTVALKGKIIHDDRKPYKRWLASQYSYAKKEQIKFKQTPFIQRSLTDRVRSIPFLSPFLVVVYLLLIKRLLFAGKPGLEYSKQRFTAEWILQKQLFIRT